MRAARRAADILVRVTVLAVAGYIAVRGVRWSEVVASLMGARALPLGAVVLLNGAMMSVKGIRLRLLLSPRRPSFAACFSTLLTSSAINNVVPLRGGDVARLWMLERGAGVTKSAAVAVAAIEHLVDVATLALLAIGASLSTPGQRWATIAAPVVLALAVAALIAARALTARARRGTSTTAASQGRLLSLTSRLAAWSRLGDVSAALDDPRTFAQVTGLAVAAWLCEVAMVLLCARALSIHVTASLAVVTLLGINLAMALPSTPASAGAFEGAAVVVLTLAGIAKPRALAFALVYHLVQVLPVTVAGLAVAVSRRPRRGARGDATPASAPTATTGVGGGGGDQPPSLPSKLKSATEPA